MNDMLYAHQHGFRQVKGFEKQPIELASDISAIMDRDEEVQACVLDILKASKKVSHTKLVQKLSMMGASSQLCLWDSSFCQSGGRESF